ncbi:MULTISPECIES: extracellular solute-binding protein [unclassified Actinomyces]|uniref:ABC transporter substrate-binding protein n=1 Tax=unclassified Actinomyces TaxID=2609248 RepID=UPI002017843B|nr:MULTISPECIES: extracellular solute-binding protein [unclassified Actinomyces]MCL3778288.1 extracellular solute-binding protein [Actinomyces sp. AC-20-1]MCL3788750.1 extracellular solute-binding protein [Actinomyces sp. 187325]MCL3791618.1 extracellular solute-binding protein [Actinomyces sp. 186855]MCL3794281.1 extracellular solute-binding protein [Actinomyces sp. 217892]
MAPAPLPSRRSFLLGATSLAVLIPLTSCSSGADEPATVQDTQAAKGLDIQGVNLTYDPNTLVNNGEPITLDWWLWDGDEQFRAFADAYRKIHPNVEIKIVNQPWDDYWTKLPLALQGEDGPAIFNIHNSHHENVLPYCEAYDVDLDALTQDFVGVDGHLVDGKVYYIDYGLMTGLIYYNKAMWQAAGLTEADVPVTWDEFREVAKKLTIRDGDSFQQAGFNFNTSAYVLLLGKHYQSGYNLFDKEGTKVQLDTETVKTDLAFLTDLYDVDHVGSPDFGSNSDEAFGQGLSAMTYSWGHYYGSLKDEYPSIDFGTFQTPVNTEGSAPYAYDRYNGESTFGINKNAPEGARQVAQDFLKFFLTSNDLLVQLCLNYSLFPSSVALAGNEEVKEHPVTRVLGSIDRYVWPGPMPATVEDNMKIAVSDVLYNGVPVDEALATAKSTIDADIAKTEFTAVENLYVHADEARG